MIDYVAARGASAQVSTPLVSRPERPVHLLSGMALYDVLFSALLALLVLAGVAAAVYAVLRAKRNRRQVPITAGHHAPLQHDPRRGSA